MGLTKCQAHFFIDDYKAKKKMSYSNLLTEMLKSKNRNNLSYQVSDWVQFFVESLSSEVTMSVGSSPLTADQASFDIDNLDDVIHALQVLRRDLNDAGSDGLIESDRTKMVEYTAVFTHRATGGEFTDKYKCHSIDDAVKEWKLDYAVQHHLISMAIVF